MKTPYRIVLVKLPEVLPAAVGRAAAYENRTRDEFASEAVRDRICRSAFTSSLHRLRALAKNGYPGSELNAHGAEALQDVLAGRMLRKTAG